MKGADDAIRVFRQHRPIYDLMEEVEKLASLTPGRLASSQHRLRLLLDEHTSAEESRVFPKATETYRDKSGVKR